MKNQTKLMLFAVIMLSLFSINFASAHNWVNQTDGFSMLNIAGSGIITTGITSNGSDIWVLDINTNFINHLDSSFNNLTDGFSTIPSGCMSPRGLFFNGTQMISIDDSTNFLCVMNLDGSSAGGDDADLPTIFTADSFGSWVAGISGNESDLWISESQSGARLFHLLPDYTSGGVIDLGTLTDIHSPYGSVFNGSDFYVTATNSLLEFWIYHLDLQGNVYENFSVTAFGDDTPSDLAVYSAGDYIMGNPITDLWITSQSNSFIYHVSDQPLPPNSAPVMTGIAIIPSTAYANSTLNCSATYTDADFDAGSVSMRFDNGTFAYTNTLTGIADGDLVSLELIYPLTKNEVWNCSINATDSLGNEGALVSTTRDISNSVPIAIDNIISPSITDPNSTITCTGLATDIDAGDSLMYAFQFRNSTDTISIGFNLTIPINNYTCNIIDCPANETIYCDFVAYDGTDVSNVLTNSTIIGAFVIPAPIPVNPFNIKCPAGDSLCPLLESTGAGLGIFIIFLSFSLPLLLTGIAIAGFIMLILYAIGKLVGSKIKA